MIELKRAVPLDSPFPLRQLDDCLSPGFFRALCDEFPGDEETRHFTNVMGGRRRLASDELEFYRFLEHRPAWRSLYAEINSAAFAGALLDHFSDELESRGCSLDPIPAFDDSYLRDRAEARDARLSSDLSSDGIGGKRWRKLRKKLHRALGMNDPGSRRESKAHLEPLSLHVHFDISAAHDGYAREVHRDLPNRVAALLIYFSDADETGGEGGGLLIHRVRQPPPRRLPPQPDPADVEEVLRIVPRRNRMVFFLATPDSYHSVEEMRGARAPRRFIYVGITASRDVGWG